MSVKEIVESIEMSARALATMNLPDGSKYNQKKNISTKVKLLKDDGMDLFKDIASQSFGYVSAKYGVEKGVIISIFNNTDIEKSSNLGGYAELMKPIDDPTRYSSQMAADCRHFLKGKVAEKKDEIRDYLVMKNDKDGMVSKLREEVATITEQMRLLTGSRAERIIPWTFKQA